MSNVRDFGAVGDGVADDVEALEHALRDGEGTLEFPRGSYRLSRTLVVDLAQVGVTSLVGHGVGRLVMEGSGPALQFLGSHRKGSANPDDLLPQVRTNERMPLIDGLEIVGKASDADGVEVQGTMQFTLCRTRISGCRHGVRLADRNRNVILSDCHIYDNRGVGVLYDHLSLHQSNIVGCHISYNRGGGVVFRGGDVRNVHIGTCDIESNHDPEGPPTANVLIDCSGSTAGTAEVTITGCTIQHNSKSPQSANIRILGRGDEGSRGRHTWGHVTITGNVLSDVSANIHLHGCRGVTIVGNTLCQGFAHNLLVEDSTAVVVGANAFDRTLAYSLGKNAEASNAVVFRNSRDCTITGLHVQGVHHAEAGLVLEACERMNVVGCTLLDNEGAGLVLRNVARSRVSGCLIRNDVDPSTPAVIVVGGRGNDITGNAWNGTAQIDDLGGRAEGNFESPPAT